MDLALSSATSAKPEVARFGPTSAAFAELHGATRLAARVTDAPIATLAVALCEERPKTPTLLSCFGPLNFSEYLACEPGHPLCQWLREPTSGRASVPRGSRASREKGEQSGIISYAAVPIFQRSGRIIGTLAVADFEERAFGSQTLNMLSELAALVTRNFDADEAEAELSTLDRNNRALTLFRSVASRVNEAPRRADLLQDVVDGVCAFTGWPVGHVYITDAACPDQLIPLPIWHIEDHERYERFRATSMCSALCKALELPGRVLETGRGVATARISTESDSERVRTAAECGLQGACAIPIFANNQIVGVFEFYLSEAREPDSWLLEVLTDVATIVGSGVEREHAEASRISVEDQLAAVIETAQDAFISIDADGQVREWNRQAERTFGWSRAEALGRDMAELIVPAEEQETHRRELARLLRTGQSRVLGNRVEMTAMRKTGATFPVELTVTPMKLRDKYVFNAFVHDISDRKRTERELRDREWERLAHAQAEAERARIAVKAAELAALTEELERRNQELDQFAYIASHDLKAPLRGIANLAVWINEDLGETVPEETREHLRLLRDRVQRMEVLIDGLLSYSRAGRACETERVDVGELVREVIELLSPPENLNFELGQLPVITAAPTPLRQVLQNLITNAIKHNDSRTPCIRIGVEERHDHYEFFVTDNGPGIPAAYQPKIWGLFQKLQPAEKVEGTGIGLALVKKIVETAGGRASVESVPGSGATFRFTWPKRRVLTPLNILSSRDAEP